MSADSYLENWRKRILINEYQKLALRTDNPDLDYTQKLLDGVMGLNGEAEECADIVKKFLFQNHDFDRQHFAKELGDVAWYLALCANTIDYDLETIFQMNIDKLKARYPDGFDSELSKNCTEGDI